MQRQAQKGFALIELLVVALLSYLAGSIPTGYLIGKPFVIYIIVAFVMIGIAEALHHVPGLEAVNAFGFDHIGLQLLLLLGGILLYATMTFLSYKKACADFEKIDL